MTEARLMTVDDEHKQMEAALRAIRDNPHLAGLISDASLKLIDANRQIRMDLLLADDKE